MKNKALIILLFLLPLLLLTACTNSSESGPDDVGALIDNAKGTDLAPYLRQDVNSILTEVGGLKAVSTDPLTDYTNDNDTLEVVENTDHTIIDIYLKGPADYNLYGIYCDLDAEDAKAILEYVAEDIEEKEVVSDETEVSGSIPVENSDEVNRLKYIVNRRNNLVSRVELSSH